MKTSTTTADPKISIVIPAYNEEHYITRCLDAIIKDIGARRDVEVIIIDNNSSDNTAAVVERYIKRYPMVKLLRETRRGANSARQAGFVAARGEFVAFPDADTEMPEGWLEKASGYLEADPKLVCVSGPFLYYDLPAWTLLLVRIFYYLGYGIQVLVKIITGKSHIIQGGNYMLRREALHKIGGQNVDLTFYGDDTDLAIRLSKIGGVKFTFNLPMHVSGRRLAKEGAFTMGLRYAINNFWIILFGRPFTVSSTEIRIVDGNTTYSPANKFKEFLIAGIAAVFFLVAFAILIYIAYYLLFTFVFRA